MGLFDRNRPNADKVREIKLMISSHLALVDSATLTVAELQCHETGYPPVETVITLHDEGNSSKHWRIAKPIRDVSNKDIQQLEY